MKPLSIAHIINPVKVTRNSDLYIAQPITFETMRQAQKQAIDNLEVTLVATCYPEDKEMVPDGFVTTPHLQQSILDFGSFRRKRKLPVIKEILDQLYETSETEYLIYTNVDIALMPDFYLQVAKIIHQGYNGFVINRRSIGISYSTIADIPSMAAEAKTNGRKHPGFDCFVFKRTMFPQFRFDGICVGANWIGRALVSNLMAWAEKFKVFTDECLTFHIGDDRTWRTMEHQQFNRHNEEILIDILSYLIDHPQAKNKEKLMKFHSMHQRSAERQIISSDEVIKKNSPSLEIPAPVTEIYPNEFRGSVSWAGYDHQYLRQDPIFIVGFPRSGTTLVQALLATQGGLVTFQESHFFNWVRNEIEVLEDRIQPKCLTNLIRRIRERVRLSQNAEAHLKALTKRSGVSVKMLFETLVIDNLLSKVSLQELKKVRWIEKTPDHIFYLGNILRFYPRAKMIYVMRNPEKSIISRRRNFSFNNEQHWTVEHYMKNWLAGVGVANWFRKNKPDALWVVKLEDIAINAEKEFRRICDFLDISFEPDKLGDYREISPSLYYPWETWKQNTSLEISPSLIDRDEFKLSDAERGKVVMLGRKALKKFGYYKKIRGSHVRSSPLIQRIFWTKKFFKFIHRKAARTIMSRLGVYKGKVNLNSQLKDFYGKHRSGWIYAVSNLRALHNPRGVFLDSFIERTFAWRFKQAKPHLRPWIGFIHIPPNVPEWFQNYQSNIKIFETKAWQDSLPFCQGLFTLSVYHRQDLENRLDVPIHSLMFPTETPEIKWDWQKFEANPEKKIVQIGWWLRKIHSIYRLPVKSLNKVFLKIDYLNMDPLMEAEREMLTKEGKFDPQMYETVETAAFLPDDMYDRLLSENLVFLHLYDSSANNTIIECIVRNTPILVNPLASVKEYLGTDYPLYFNTIEEAAEKAETPDLIYKAHQYLVNHPIKNKLSGEYFAQSFKNSEIYQSLQVS